MFVANTADGAHGAIRFVGTPGPSVPVRTSGAPYRTQKGQLLTIAGMVLAAAVAGFGAGIVASGSPAGVTGAGTGPMPGEFRLGPGNAQPPGIVVPLS